MNTNIPRQTGQRCQRVTDGFLAVRGDYSGYSRRPSGAQPPVPVVAELQQPRLAPVPTTPIKSKSFIQQPAAVNAPAVDAVPKFALPVYVPPARSGKIVRKRRSWLRLALRGMAVSFGVLLIISGSLFWRMYDNLHKVFRGNDTVAALSAEHVAPGLLKGEGDGRVNILLLGIGGKNHDGGDLTDTMVVLSVDPANSKAAMLSIPRDLWVKMPVNYFGAHQKINAAYSAGKYTYLGKNDRANTGQQAVEAGFASVDQAVGDVLGIAINYHVLVDFQAFEQAVNTVNGVTLDVKEQLYDPTMAWENANNPVLAAAGLQTMNGKQALMYARSRETSSDFARSERQRQLLIALKQKMLTLGTLSNPTKIDSLMSAFGDNVQTDLSTKAAARLYDIMKKINDGEITSLSLTAPTSLVTTDRVGAVSVVRPKAGFNTYGDIQAYVKAQLPDGYLVKERAGVYVVGANDALRAHTVTMLSGYGYRITGSSVVTTVPSGATIVDLTGGEKPYTQHYLQDRYGVAAQSNLPDGLQVPQDAQFVIIAGT
jgi:LCP family protein required for cell wall assembly